MNILFFLSYVFFSFWATTIQSSAYSGPIYLGVFYRISQIFHINVYMYVYIYIFCHLMVVLYGIGTHLILHMRTWNQSKSTRNFMKEKTHEIYSRMLFVSSWSRNKDSATMLRLCITILLSCSLYFDIVIVFYFFPYLMRIPNTLN